MRPHLKKKPGVVLDSMRSPLKPRQVGFSRNRHGIRGELKSWEARRGTLEVEGGVGREGGKGSYGSTVD